MVVSHRVATGNQTRALWMRGSALKFLIISLGLTECLYFKFIFSVIPVQFLYIFSETNSQI